MVTITIGAVAAVVLLISRVTHQALVVSVAVAVALVVADLLVELAAVLQSTLAPLETLSVQMET